MAGQRLTAASSGYPVSANFFAEGDQVSLSADLRIKGNQLSDRATGASHALHPQASQVLKYIISPVSVYDLLGYISDLGLEPYQGSEIMGFLNQIGGLHVRRSLISTLRHLPYLATAYLVGAQPVLLARRWSLNATGLALGAIRGLLPVIILSLPISILSFGAGLPGQVVAAWWVSGLFILWATIVTHESAHAAVVWRARQPGAVLQQGLRLGVLHSKLNPGAEISSALIGPLVGAVISLALGGVGASLTNTPSIRLLGLILAVFHILSWLPGYGDGRSLLTNIKMKVKA